MGMSVGVTVGGFVAVAVGRDVAVGNGVFVAVFVGWTAAIRVAAGAAAGVEVGTGLNRNPRQFRVRASHRANNKMRPHLNTLVEPVCGSWFFSLIMENKKAR